jgi:acyl-ACP thioesterase
LDIVNHANSVKYLEWCLDCLEPEVLLKKKITSLNMNYLKEVSFLEVVEISRKQNTFTLSKEGKTCFALELEY